MNSIRAILGFVFLFSYFSFNFIGQDYPAPPRDCEFYDKLLGCSATDYWNAFHCHIPCEFADDYNHPCDFCCLNNNFDDISKYSLVCYEYCGDRSYRCGPLK
ncbi:hypothetical protein Anas_10762 [Armadillidium nasatum]|uniref:Uncharacterized protein n=1 Tax=Armadillidium nasatum TaxID=96803 RepID=A0A5N5SN25_9CRUS|nr:hypothetical protein Anas_10762 [Armadillidium nasatum]